ncbi:uncharacterized protein LOC141535750 isoform X2 [Cotesia typhae]|uniref:uncharacterized protein LOC141535750 isoform X2 n=1 Tax=Cotesia typhae TaxID=2053667 RepID=UPI003D688E3A
MNLSNCKICTAIILMFYLSVHCRRAPKKSEVISIEVNNKLYKMYSVKKSWLEAVLDCEDRNSKIADVNSIEAKFLARAMLKHRPTIESVWIGGYEELSKEEMNKVEESLVRRNELQRRNFKNNSTESKIKSVTESLVKKNELQRRNFKNNSKVVKEIKYSNGPKLYYAFEGPLVGKLEDINNNKQLVGKKKLTHKYQKYISSQSLKVTKTFIIK